MQCAICKCAICNEEARRRFYSKGHVEFAIDDSDVRDELDVVSEKPDNFFTIAA